MLSISIPQTELFDSKHNEFIYIKAQTITLEHSLVSISKWESKWHKPFFSQGKDKKKRTKEESLDYIRCMTLTQNVDPNTYLALTSENFKEIEDYVNDPMTATWFNERDKRKSANRQLTSELIYCYMFLLNIPKECEKWHINRLITLIRVCGIESQPKKKMSSSEALHHTAAMNKARRARPHI